MKVYVTNHERTVERDLEDVLTPSPMAYEFSGQMEEALGMAQKNSRMLGKLAAVLVEKGLMTLDEALNAASNYDDVSLTP